MQLQEKFFDGNIFSKVVSVESIPTILIKTNSTAEVLQRGCCKIALIKFSEIFLRDLFCLSFSSRLLFSGLQLYCKDVFDKNIQNLPLTLKAIQRFILCKRQCFYFNADANISKWLFVDYNKGLCNLFLTSSSESDDCINFCKQFFHGLFRNSYNRNFHTEM